MELRDLPPQKDPRGGSPKTPCPLSVSEFENSSRIFNGGFWGQILKHAVSFLIGGLSAAFFLGGKSRDVSDLLTRVAKLETAQEIMNRDGTSYSHMKIDTERQMIDTNTTRINELYSKIEPIGAMQAKIEGLQRQIDAKK